MGDLDDKGKEECGVVGIFNVPNAAEVTFLGLHALQHRGQESAGIVVSNGHNVRSRKGMGLLSQVFSTEDISRLEGHIGIGHVRYSTTGASKPQNTQPLVMDYSEGLLVIAHNGNLINAKQLRDEYEAYGSIFQTSTDSEVVIHLMAKPSHVAKSNNIAHCLGHHIKGSYSFIFMTKNKLIAVRDPNGFRPLCLGRIGNGYVVASETCAFDQMGAEFIREIEAGEAITIDDNGLHSEFIVPKEQIKPSHCIFEQIYFARPDSNIFGENVHLVRKRLGMNLAKESPVEADLVSSIPTSGDSAAIGYSEVSGLPLDRALIRNHYVGRTFLLPLQAERSRAVQLKHNAVRDVVYGKRIVLVDDSLIRGTTLKGMVAMLREYGAAEVHMRVSCPPNRHPCFYGIDFPTKAELIAANHTIPEIEKILNLDSLRYLSLDGLYRSVSLPRNHYCVACFTGEYPLNPEVGMSDKFRMGCGGTLEEETA